MGQAKNRGTFEQRKAAAIEAGHVKTIFTSSPVVRVSIPTQKSLKAPVRSHYSNLAFKLVGEEEVSLDPSVRLPDEL